MQRDSCHLPAANKISGTYLPGCIYCAIVMWKFTRLWSRLALQLDLQVFKGEIRNAVGLADRPELAPKV